MIDVDFAGDDREKVYQYIIERFTPEKTAYIAAFSTLQDRGCIDVLAGGLGYQDLDKVMEIKNKFDEFFSGYSKIVQEEVDTEGLVENGETESSSITFDNHKIYMLHIAKEKKKKQLDNIKNQYDKLIKDNQDLFYYLKGLKGTIVAKGTHPSGIIGSPITLADNIGLFYKDGDKNMPVSTCAMKAVDSLNYVKFDILGLKTVGIIKDACEYAGIPYLKSCALDWDDAKVWDNMIQAQQGVFQFEGDYAFALLKDFRPYTINHMSMVNAALRPSGKSYRDRMIAGEHNENPSEEIDTLLASNNGYLIFQEDTIKFLTDICGFTGSAADTTRRCIDENSQILMGNGNYKKIKDIEIGDIVQTFNNYNISEPKKVKDVFNNGIKRTYSIETLHGYKLKATGNHPVLTQRGYVNVSELTNSDFLMTPKKIQSITDNKRPNQRLDSSTMYLIGLLLGDGCIGYKNNIHFTNHEKCLIDKFEMCVNHLSRSKYDCEFYYMNQSGVNVDTIYSVYIKTDIYKDLLIKLLDKFDLRHNASCKYIPEEFMSYPVGDKLSSLLGGLFNTDGGYNSQNLSIEYYTTSFLLAMQIKSLLAKYSIYSYVNIKYVNNYDYNYYTLIIQQIDSLKNFKKLLLFIIGKKKNDYQYIIDKASNCYGKYNYLLPNEYKQEILQSSEKCNIKTCVTKNSFYITDVTAKKIVDNLYCPKTYELLLADYFPVPIKNITEYGFMNVYDIEVEDNHNFVANGLIVHNCIGKKDKEGLEQQLPKILNGYCNHSPKERTIAEEEAKQFVQIVKDSSEYQFGYNHSTAYSMNGYECVWLRTYYTVEFIAAYLNRAENKDDTNYGIELAKMNNIEILPIKFGKSSAKYTIDRKNNAIYKGIASIKYCNESIATELLELSKTHYNSFFDLLDDISEKTSVNNRQLCILTGLNFFSDFGKNKYLLNLITLFNGVKKKEGKSKSPKVILPSLRTCSVLKKDKFEMYEEYGLTEYLAKKYSKKETAKQYGDIDNLGLLDELASRLNNKSMSVIEQCKFEKEYLEYIIYTNPDIADFYYIVSDFKTFKDATRPHLVLRNLKTGEEVKTKIKQGKIYRQNPFGEFCILKIEGFTWDFKSKFVQGEWTKSDELEPILESYEVIKNGGGKND